MGGREEGGVRRAPTCTAPTCSPVHARRSPAAGCSSHEHASLCTSMQLCASTLTACSRFCLARAYSSLHKHATPCTHTVAFSSWSLNCHAALCTHAGHLQQVALCTSMHASLCTRLLPAAGSALHRHSSSMLMLVACSGSLFALACCSLHSHATLCMHTSCLQQVAPCTSCSSMHAPAGAEPVGRSDLRMVPLAPCHPPLTHRIP